MSLFSASIVSKAAYEKDPDAFGSKPVCTGPFQVESYERGSQLVLAPNPNYWRMGEDGKPLPYVDKAVLKYVPESNSRVLGLQNGDFDVILAVPLNQAASIKARTAPTPRGRRRPTGSTTSTSTTPSRRSTTSASGSP